MTHSTVASETSAGSSPDLAACMSPDELDTVDAALVKLRDSEVPMLPESQLPDASTPE